MWRVYRGSDPLLCAEFMSRNRKMPRVAVARINCERSIHWPRLNWRKLKRVCSVIWTLDRRMAHTRSVSYSFLRLAGRPGSLVELGRHAETVKKSFLLGCFFKIPNCRPQQDAHTPKQAHSLALEPLSLTSLARNNLVRNKLTAHLALQILGLKAFFRGDC